MEGKKCSKSEGRELPYGKSFSMAALVFCVQILVLRREEF